MSVLYFAYGSNLDEAQMQTRCPGAVRVARATLPDHVLLFAGQSKRWNGCVATIQPAPGREVPGLLYDLSDQHLAHLDRIEGHPGVYLRAPCLVIDEHGQPRSAQVYSLPGAVAGLPPGNYLEVIRLSYRRLGLDEEGLLWAIPRSPRRVFVYGTLLAGESNHRLLQHARLLGPATTAATFSMVSLGSFPGLVRGGTTSISGEVYEVDDATLATLDQLEGHPHFYRRTPISLDTLGEVEAYLLTPAQAKGHTPIPSGSWRRHRRG
jgi:gamma-glutamylcyclotransferase (GGCT)/AIG2-like uncharacterized protein YtfP